MPEYDRPRSTMLTLVNRASHRVGVDERVRDENVCRHRVSRQLVIQLSISGRADTLPGGAPRLLRE